MKAHHCTLVILGILLLGSCSRSFYHRQYTQGWFIDSPSKITGSESWKATDTIFVKSTCVNADEKITDEHLPVKEFSGTSVPENFIQPEHDSSLSASQISEMSITLPADTIPSPPVVTPLELRNAKIIATACTLVVIASWFMLPLIGGIVFFLIQFCFGGLGLIFTSAYAETKDKYLKVLGIILMISFIGVVLFGVSSLIYCTFFDPCE